MADTFTTNLNLTKPEVGASTDTWGTKINADLDALDAIFAAGGTAVNVKFASANFDDNAKAIFGTGDDLEIYHDGSNSYIKDGGTGDLRIASNDLYIKNGADTETKAYFLDNGAVGLYFDDAVKFATTSSGATVTGTLTATTLAGTLSTAAQTNITSLGTLTTLTVDEITINGDTITATDDFIIDVTDDITLDADGGDIFFKDGGTQKMHLDGSGRLLIGVDSGDGFNDDAMLRLQRTGDRIFQSFKVDADQEAAIFFGDVDDDIECGIQYQAANRALEFSTGNNSEAMRIDSSGNCGISTTAPNANLHVGSSNATGDATNPAIQIGGTSSYRMGLYTSAEGAVIENKNGDDGIQFRVKTAGEAMRIDGGTGNVGIGTSSISNLLQVDVDSASTTTDSISVQNSGVSSVGHTTGLRFQFNAAVPSAIRSRLTNTSNGAGTLSFFTSADGASGNLSERMGITSAGNVLIGTTADFNSASKLQVTGGASGGNGAVTFMNSADNGPALCCFKTPTTTSSTARFIQFYADSGNTPMGGISGNGASNVQFVTLSDEREKENIIPVNNVLDKLMNLNVVSFDWKKNDEHVKAGFIAQNVEKYFPEYIVENVSNEDAETRKGTTGGMSAGYIAVLTKAIQEQQTQIDALQSEINNLKGE